MKGLVERIKEEHKGIENIVRGVSFAYLSGVFSAVNFIFAYDFMEKGDYETAFIYGFASLASLGLSFGGFVLIMSSRYIGYDNYKKRQQQLSPSIAEDKKQ